MKGLIALAQSAGRPSPLPQLTSGQHTGQPAGAAGVQRWGELTQGRSVLYLGYVGQRPGLPGPLFKYGVSHQFARRAAAHTRTFGRFDALLVAEYDRNRQAEALLTRLLRHRGALLTLEGADGRRHREIACPLAAAAAFAAPEQLLRDLETAVLADMLAASAASGRAQRGAPPLFHRFEPPPDMLAAWRGAACGTGLQDSGTAVPEVHICI